MIINRSFSSSFAKEERFGSLKSLVLLVVIAILATSNSYAQASFESIDGLRYLIDTDAKTATLTANVGEKYFGDIVVPEKVKASDGVEYPVTAFGDNAFKECRGLKSITIPSSVTSLGNHCFQSCSGLTNITIPSSVTSLGDWCFSGCVGLTSITIPSSVTYLGWDCFSSCPNLEKATFQGNLPQNTINCSLLSTCIFYVPKAYLQDYKDALGSKYSYIYASKDSESGEEKPNEQCAVPTISYADGKLTFASSTPNAEYHYTITDTDMASDAYSQDGTVKLSAAYNISAYATADGYKASDKATATLYWVEANLQNNTITDTDMASDAYSQDGIVKLSAAYNISAYATADGYKASDKATATLYWVEANLQNNTTNINQTATRGIIVTSNDGIITLSGLNNDETVRFYTVDGKQLGVAKAINGTASQAVSESVVIAKMGNQTIKIAVK